MTKKKKTVKKPPAKKTVRKKPPPTIEPPKPIADDKSETEMPAATDPTKTPETEKPEKPEKKRGPGRPAGSKNVEKPGLPVSRAPLKAPGSVKDLDHALPTEGKRWNALLDEKSKRDGKDYSRHKVPETVGDLNASLIVVPADACEGILTATFELIGQALQVEARPDPKAIKECGKQWSAALVYVEIDPKWVIIGGAVGTTAYCCVPMVQEKRAVDRGDIPPLKEREEAKRKIDAT